MSLPAPPPLGHPVPNTRHAVSVQMSTWQDMCGMALGEARVKDAQQIGYLANACIKRFASRSESCLLFPAHSSASACKAFLTSSQHGDCAVAPEAILLRIIKLDVDDPCMLGSGDKEYTFVLHLYAVFFPKESLQLAMIFWRLTGTGISSRLAERSHPGGGALAHDKICQRIADLLERSPVDPPRRALVTKSDVYLYHTQSIVFGFPYELTLKILETYGPSCKFFGFGTNEELNQLEAYLETEANENLDRIRRLADRYGFVVVVDETIGSFTNVDVLGVADVLITSLTKSFSGYADVIGGSVVLNCSSSFYSVLKTSLDVSYHNDLYGGDAIQLEFNSRDFLSRAAQINTTASHLVDFSHTLVFDPTSTVTAVYYPKVCWSVNNYRAHMRPPTKEFTAGYGGLFTLEFETVEATTAFFNAIDVHKGSSLGANLTLAQPYVQTVFQKEKAWAARYGLKETIVRISVGLEDMEPLLESFKVTVQKADETKLKSRYQCML
ncbi:pyridoxal phosphate-dependent transferase [Trichophaea hybrida]|nr:pyridoxal phosphate-dependent transferase [Trichophaea hybrida]